MTLEIVEPSGERRELEDTTELNSNQWGKLLGVASSTITGASAQSGLSFPSNGSGINREIRIPVSQFPGMILALGRRKHFHGEPRGVMTPTHPWAATAFLSEDGLQTQQQSPSRRLFIYHTKT